MISEYTLKMLCDKYNLSVSKIVNKNNNILEYGNFLNIDRTLDYLINVLTISTKNIEKCPSILYRNVDGIKQNVEFLKKQDIHFSNVESCLHVLSSDPNELKETYNYVAENYGVNAINKNTSILSCSIEIIKEVENLNLNIERNSNLSIAEGISSGYTKLEEIIKIVNSKEYEQNSQLFSSRVLAKSTLERIVGMLNSKEYKEHPEFFTSTVLAESNLERITEILKSKEYKEHPELFSSCVLAKSTPEKIFTMLRSKEYKKHPELFTSTVLADSNLERVIEILKSKEYKEHPELFKSSVLAHSTPEKIFTMLKSKEYKEHPELFTSTVLAYSTPEKIIEILKSKEYTVLAHSTPEKICEILGSKEYEEHSELFTPTVLADSDLEQIQKIINSDEFKKYPKLFTSEVLAHSTLEKIQKIINSDEFRSYPYLFTSEVLAHGTLEKIQKIINSDEFRKYSHLFTPQVLSRTNIEHVTILLNMPYWQDKRFKNLLSSTIVANSKKMIIKIPILIEMAEYYGIDEFLSSSFFVKSPSQNFALINYLKDTNYKLIIDGKLNPLFQKPITILKQKYGIDIKELMTKYPYREDNKKKVKIMK